MKVPLIMQYDSALSKLLIVRNGETVQVDAPFYPYYLTDSLFDVTEHQILGRDISTGKEIKIYKHINTDISMINRMAVGRRCSDIRTYFINFTEQIEIDQPEFILQYAQTEPLKFMYFDIEVLTDGSGKFPTPDKYPIVHISYAFDNEKPQVLEGDGTNDFNILDKFLTIIQNKNPDIICSYNGSGFDLPYILDRLKKNEMSPRRMSRWDKDPFYKEREGIKNTEIPGRVSFDIYLSVLKDQSLLGIKNRKMKTVAQRYHLRNVLELDLSELKNIRALIGTDKLRDYSISDVEVTRGLSRVYWPVKATIAEMVNITIDQAVNGYPSLLPKITFGRKLKELNYYSLDTNNEKYGRLLKDKEDGSGEPDAEPETLKYEAAYVDIYQTGRFEKVDKLDFKSQYPSCILTFNLSPETVRMVGTDAFTHDRKNPEESGPLTHVRDGSVLKFRFPDNVYKKDIIIDVDTKHEGFICEMINHLFAERKSIKDRMDASKSKREVQSLDSQQQAVKVLMNSIYGYCGQRTAHFGSLPVAIATVQLSKWMIKKVVSWLGDRVIEVDTDGIYITGYTTGEEKVLTTKLAEAIRDTFGVESRMSLGHDEYGAGFFHKAKNYVLQEKDRVTGEWATTYHGVAFKSSKHSEIYREALRRMTTAVLNQEADLLAVYREMIDMSKYEPEDFKMSITLGKPFGGYKGNILQVKLCKMMEKKTKTLPSKGDTIEYAVHHGNEYVPFEEFDISKVDIGYYKGEVEKVMNLFHSDPQDLAQPTFF